MGFRSMAGRMNLPPRVSEEAINLQRALDVKNMRLGLSSTYSTVICLHLAADRAGQPLDVKAIHPIAGEKSKNKYLITFNNVKKILGLDSSTSLQEIGVQLSEPELVGPAKAVLDNYEKHLNNNFGQKRMEQINLSTSKDLCAAFYAAAKLNQVKLDVSRLVAIANTKKKTITDLGEQMLEAMPAAQQRETSSGSGRSSAAWSASSILSSVQEESVQDLREKKSSAKKEIDQEFDFQVWKREILEAAVQAGFEQYKQYL